MIEEKMDLSVVVKENNLSFNQIEYSGVNSILLNTPSKSNKRVSFDSTPTISEISFNNGKPKSEQNQPLVFQIKDKVATLNKSLLSDIKKKARKYLTMLVNKNNIILKYRRKDDLDEDMRALGLKQKTYIENKLIVTNLSYKENEQSIRDYFSKIGEIEKIVVETNSKGFCTGKATLTFFSSINMSKEFCLNNRKLRLERIQKQVVNTTRLFISHINKRLNISNLRSILKKAGHNPKNIRIDLNDDKNKFNKGYGFLEFNNSEHAAKFIEEFPKIQFLIGPQSYVEYSHEKKNQ